MDKTSNSNRKRKSPCLSTPSSVLNRPKRGGSQQSLPLTSAKKLHSKEVKSELCYYKKTSKEYLKSSLVKWRPMDDFLLIMSMSKLNNLFVVHRTVEFSCEFTLEELTERWYQLLYNHTISRSAQNAIRSLPFTFMERFHRLKMWSVEDDNLIKSIPSTKNPDLETFQQLILNNPHNFEQHKNADDLYNHWQLMKKYMLLCDQMGSDMSDSALKNCQLISVLNRVPPSAVNLPFIENEINLELENLELWQKRIHTLLLDVEEPLTIKDFNSDSIVALVRLENFTYLMRRSYVTIGFGDSFDINLDNSTLANNHKKSKVKQQLLNEAKADQSTINQDIQTQIGQSNITGQDKQMQNNQNNVDLCMLTQTTDISFNSATSYYNPDVCNLSALASVDSKNLTDSNQTKCESSLNSANNGREIVVDGEKNKQTTCNSSADQTNKIIKGVDLESTQVTLSNSNSIDVGYSLKSNGDPNTQFNISHNNKQAMVNISLNENAIDITTVDDAKNGIINDIINDNEKTTNISNVGGAKSISNVENSTDPAVFCGSINEMGVLDRPVTTINPLSGNNAELGNRQETMTTSKLNAGGSRMKANLKAGSKNQPNKNLDSNFIASISIDSDNFNFVLTNNSPLPILVNDTIIGQHSFIVIKDNYRINIGQIELHFIIPRIHLIMTPAKPKFNSINPYKKYINDVSIKLGQTEATNLQKPIDLLRNSECQNVQSKLNASNHA